VRTTLPVPRRASLASLVLDNRGVTIDGDQDWKRLRTSFDATADTYHQARPDYPETLFDTLVQDTSLKPGARLLEIGCGTGKATLPLARRGYRITCVELGGGLAAAARRNLAAFDGVQVADGSFETWLPTCQHSFDLVYAATSWHWLDPAARCALAWRWLRPSGHLAIWSALHVSPANGDPFFTEIQQIYDEIGEGLPPGSTFPQPGELGDCAAELDASGLFTTAVVRHFDWEVSYDANGYIQLLDTFSGHIEMAQWQRDRLYGEIRRRLAARSGGRLRRHWGAAMTVARRLEPGR
jgi:SAM-dependent methyltransferase